MEFIADFVFQNIVYFWVVNGVYCWVFLGLWFGFFGSMIWVYCWEFVVTGDPEAFCQSFGWEGTNPVHCQAGLCSWWCLWRWCFYRCSWFFFSGFVLDFLGLFLIFWVWLWERREREREREEREREIKIRFFFKQNNFIFKIKLIIVFN